MNISELVGVRILAKFDTYGRNGVTENRVLEVSPSGNWAKLQSINGNKFWKPVTDIALVEVLKEIKPATPVGE